MQPCDALTFYSNNQVARFQHESNAQLMLLRKIMMQQFERVSNQLALQEFREDSLLSHTRYLATELEEVRVQVQEDNARVQANMLARVKSWEAQRAQDEAAREARKAELLRIPKNSQTQEKQVAVFSLASQDPKSKVLLKPLTYERAKKNLPHTFIWIRNLHSAASLMRNISIHVPTWIQRVQWQTKISIITKHEDQFIKDSSPLLLTAPEDQLKGHGIELESSESEKKEDIELALAKSRLEKARVYSSESRAVLLAAQQSLVQDQRRLQMMNQAQLVNTTINNSTLFCASANSLLDRRIKIIALIILSFSFSAVLGTLIVWRLTR